MRLQGGPQPTPALGMLLLSQVTAVSLSGLQHTRQLSESRTWGLGCRTGGQWRRTPMTLCTTEHPVAHGVVPSEHGPATPEAHSHVRPRVWERVSGTHLQGRMALPSQQHWTESLGFCSQHWWLWPSHMLGLVRAAGFVPSLGIFRSTAPILRLQGPSACISGCGNGAFFLRVLSSCPLPSPTSSGGSLPGAVCPGFWADPGSPL